jgi:methyltransferase OMS1, mitochondrial
VAELLRGNRLIGMFGAGAAALCVGLFTASLVMNLRSEKPVYITGQEPCMPTGRPSIQSPMEFDQHLDKAEWRLGVTKLRKRLAREAHGHVLEVAIGAGRNLEFYDWDGLLRPDELAQKQNGHNDKTQPPSDDPSQLRSLTGLDISPSMLDLSVKRLRQFAPHGIEALPNKPSFTSLARPLSLPDGSSALGIDLVSSPVRLLVHDAEQPIPPPPSPARRYDTVVQSFGLCSVRHPVALLCSMAAVCAPDTGRILLVEHGRSWWGFVNGLLDQGARGHFERFGCWWNRDVEWIVDQAVERTPGLEVVAFERPGWITVGTHVWVELRVRDVGRGGQGEPRKVEAEPGKIEVESREARGEPAEKSAGWLGPLNAWLNHPPKSSDGDQAGRKP